MGKIPEIKSGPIEGLQDAKKEYIYLQSLLNKKDNFPMGGSGWNANFSNKIQDRMNYLRAAITDLIIKGDKK